LRALFPYPRTSLLGCFLGSFVGCFVVGFPFGPVGLLFAPIGFPLGVVFAVPVNFVLLPLVWLRVPEIPSKPVWLLAVGCVGGFFSPSLIVLLAAFGERLIKYNPRLALEWHPALLASVAGAVAGTVCAAFFLSAMRRRDAAPKRPQG
jgi:hypothetical protein